MGWKRGGVKYLGVHLGDKQTKKKNWEGVLEKVEGKLAKRRSLLPHMSHRGRVLIINNLLSYLRVNVEKRVFVAARVSPLMQRVSVCRDDLGSQFSAQADCPLSIFKTGYTLFA